MSSSRANLLVKNSFQNNPSRIGNHSFRSDHTAVLNGSADHIHKECEDGSKEAFYHGIFSSYISNSIYFKSVSARNTFQTQFIPKIFRGVSVCFINS